MNLSRQLGQDPYQIILSNLSLKDVESLFLSGNGNKMAITKTFQNNHYWSEKLAEFGLSPVFNAQGLYHIASVLPKEDLLLACMKIESFLFTDDVINSYSPSVLEILNSAVKSGSTFIFGRYVGLKEGLDFEELSKFLTFIIIPIADKLVRDQMLEAFLGESDGEEYKKELDNILTPAVIKRTNMPLTLFGYISELSNVLFDLVLYRPELLNSDPEIFREIVEYYTSSRPNDIELLIKTIEDSGHDYDAILLIIAAIQGNVNLFREKLPVFRELSDVWQENIEKEVSFIMDSNRAIAEIFLESEGVNWLDIFVQLIVFSEDDEFVDIVFNNPNVDIDLLTEAFREANIFAELSIEKLLALAKTESFKQIDKRLLYESIAAAFEQEYISNSTNDLNELLIEYDLEYLIPV